MEYFNSISVSDKDKLISINNLVDDNREDMVDEWVNSSKLKYLVAATNMTTQEFKDEHAYKIFNFFYTYTTTSHHSQTCPTAKALLVKYKSTEDIIQFLTIACTEFKNIFLRLIVSMDIELKPKLDIFSIFANLFDLNLTALIAEYTTHLELIIKNNKAHLDLFENNAVVSKTDAKGIITFSSAAYSKLTGFKSSELVGKSHKLLRHPEVSSRVYEQMWKRLKKGKQWQGKLMNYTKNKELFFIHAKIIPTFDLYHNIVGYTAIRTNETDSINARTDGLTGIMNRLDFDNNLSTLTNKMAKFTLVMIDIDFFKDVNDNHGHVIGDEVLKHFTDVVGKVIRPTDIFARWGGEEFALILKDTENNFQAHIEAVERIRKVIEDYEFPTIGNKTASFGMVSYSDDFDSVLSFVDAADKCLYHAKGNGRNCIAFKTDISSQPEIFHAK